MGSNNPTRPVGVDFLASAIDTLNANKSLCDRAIGQVSDRHLRTPLDPHTNSIAVIMKHIAGNLRSRWTDFLTTDGEKANRDRDQEFVDEYPDRKAVLDDWESGWLCVLQALAGLTEEQLKQTVSIRGVPHSVPLAIERSLGHTCYHVGQIVLLTRHFAGDQWQDLTIPRGQSKQFNRQHWGAVGKSHS